MATRIPSLVGRQAETEAIEALLRPADGRGGALVLRGDVGIGKTALLALARERAAEQGRRVLALAGVQAESHLPFAGLHQLLRPVLQETGRLTQARRETLLAAVGLHDAGRPEPFRIALAVLDLLTECASGRPLLLLVDDVQWLDRSTSDLLAFVARRLSSDPVVLLAAATRGETQAPVWEGVEELPVSRLDADHAARLLDAGAPALAPFVRARLLEEADGNPLALVELPLAAEGLESVAVIPRWLPLTANLQRAFETRIPGLPDATRTLLLAAALDAEAATGDVLSAAGAVTGGPVTVDGLVPAVEAGLVRVDRDAVRFRHPLVRSAIHQAASVTQRTAVHAALAAVHSGRPDSGIWHLAASTVPPDKAVAEGLQRCGERALRRGAVVAAVHAFEQAAAFAPDGRRQADLMLRSAELAVGLGRRDLVRRLVRTTERLEPTAKDTARLLWISESLTVCGGREPVAVRTLLRAAERMRADGETALSVRLTGAAAAHLYRGNGESALHAEVLRTADRLAAEPDGRCDTTGAAMLLIAAHAAPVERAASVLEAARALAHRTDDAAALHTTARALWCVGAPERADPFLTAAVERLRHQGRLAPLAEALALRASGRAATGRCDPARVDADEARRLARETGQPEWEATALTVLGCVAALRDDAATAHRLIGHARAIAVRLNSPLLHATVRMARGTALSCSGDHAEAYAQLRWLTDPADPAHHMMTALWTVGDLAEAAAHCGEKDDARAVLERLAPLARRTPAARVRLAARHARAVLARGDEGEAAFLSALDADLTGWSLERARLRLAYGEWLRRRRRVLESRAPLRAARDTFDDLGAAAWSRRARQELEATGETTRQRSPRAADRLTPQELQIAMLAAEGLSNKEIGARLYVSHRTVSTHLSRIFPKLGVTSRSQLARHFPPGP
ncbi:AAA family ATPase [Actinacidiphila glaucinigra]|uniref:AAA family ATPase n=1 Tax=Actinacidiphila glaucinigra TaxID=235986 RepID=UPI0035D66663